MKKILYSMVIAAAAAAVVIGGTTAFFSDTETSTGNTFTAGAIDLKIDSEAHWNNMVCVKNETGTGPAYWWQPEANFVPKPGHVPAKDSECFGTWGQPDGKDIVLGEKFFSYDDVKPGDNGENTISIHVDNNDAYMCMYVSNMADADNDCTEPELVDDPSCDQDDTANGDLSPELKFFAWVDDGDNIWEPVPGSETNEPILFDNISGPASDVLNGKVYPMFTPATGAFPGGETKYIGLYWCYGDIDTAGGVLSCDGELVNNASQTDSLTADMAFYVEQARNNDEFVCPADLD